MIYFITALESDKKNNLQLKNCYTNGLGTLKLIHSQPLNKQRKEYIQYVYSLDFKIGKDFDIDKSTGQNIISLRLQLNKTGAFKKDILIYKDVKKLNYFIYDFKCFEKKSKFSMLKLNKCEQFNLFKDAIFSDDSNNNEKEKDLLEDSINVLIDSDKKFSLELFLDLLNSYYNKTTEVNILFEYLGNNFDFIYNCEKLNSNYTNMLNNLEKKIEKEHDNFLQSLKSISIKNLNIFHNLIFIYRTKFEREKIQEMIEEQSYWDLYDKIILNNVDYYLNLGLILPKDLIIKILKQDSLNLDTIKKLLSFGNSIEDILKMIINCFSQLCECCIKKQYKIIMSDFDKHKISYNLEELITNINTIIDYELKSRFFIIIFDNDFWLFYIDYYKNLRNFKKLRLIENTILNCKKVDKNLDINNISKIIYETEINMIKNGELKNEKILDFFMKIILKIIKIII